MSKKSHCARLVQEKPAGTINHDPDRFGEISKPQRVRVCAPVYAPKARTASQSSQV
jgi:hypothetical protein